MNILNNTAEVANISDVLNDYFDANFGTGIRHIEKKMRKNGLDDIAIARQLPSDSDYFLARHKELFKKHYLNTRGHLVVRMRGALKVTVDNISVHLGLGK